MRSLALCALTVLFLQGASAFSLPPPATKAIAGRLPSSASIPARRERLPPAAAPLRARNPFFGGGGTKKEEEKAAAPVSEISKKRREQLGIGDDEREYDLDRALDVNTDPLITKIIAGSLIVVMIGLLIAGVIVPSLTDYGEGVCSPIQHGGRC